MKGKRRRRVSKHTIAKNKDAYSADMCDALVQAGVALLQGSSEGEHGAEEEDTEDGETRHGVGWRRAEG